MIIDSIKKRRSFYSIGKEMPVGMDKVEEIIKEAILYTPSPFNSQSARVVLLKGENHTAFWEMVRSAIKKIVSEAAFKSSSEKIDSFSAGYATILFFEDRSVVKSLQNSFPLYKENFPVWSEQSSGMLQFVIWTALCEQGLGASLQHYNELVEKDVKEKWNLSPDWKLIAQMPFGGRTAEAGDKDFKPIEERFFVF